VESIYNPTPGIDITTSYNIYGCEVTSQSVTTTNGVTSNNITWVAYFNGVEISKSTQTLGWQSTPPSILLGWNPASSPYFPAVMKIDYVRVWAK
jgi:hypothetical protein